MMPRPMVLVFLLIMFVVTSQFEWKQELMSELAENSSITQKQQRISKREEVVKEKIILSQEKNIQKLNELIRSLQEQLLQCKGSNDRKNGSATSLTKNVNDHGWQQIHKD